MRPLEANRLYTRFYGGLVIPGAAHIETTTALPLLHQITTHFGTHYTRLDVHPCELSEGDDSNQRLLAAFRTGDPAVASAAIDEHLIRCEQFALWLADQS